MTIFINSHKKFFSGCDGPGQHGGVAVVPPGPPGGRRGGIPHLHDGEQVEVGVGVGRGGAERGDGGGGEGAEEGSHRALQVSHRTKTFF